MTHEHTAPAPADFVELVAEMRRAQLNQSSTASPARLAILEDQVDAAIERLTPAPDPDPDPIEVFSDGVCDGCRENKPVRVCNGTVAAGICLCEDCPWLK